MQYHWVERLKIVAFVETAMGIARLVQGKCPKQIHVSGAEKYREYLNGDIVLKLNIYSVNMYLYGNYTSVCTNVRFTIWGTAIFVGWVERRWRIRRSILQGIRMLRLLDGSL